MPIANNILKLITQGAGTVNAITATLTPAILPDSQCMVIVRSIGFNNSTTVTFQLNGWSAYPLKARGNVAIRVGDTGAANFEMIFVFNTAGSYWELLNPATSVLQESMDYADLVIVAAIDQEITDRDNAIASAVAGLLDYRGVFDASVNAYPSSGGSGVAGAIVKSDFWIVSVAGVLPTGLIVEAGDLVIAKIDTPGNTQSNWNIIQYNIGYTPENAVNKSTSVETDQASDTKYPSVKSVYDWATLQLNNKVFPIDFGNFSNWSIADNNTYYLGLSTAVGVSADQISFVPLYAGTIVAIITEVFSAGTVGSNTEDGTLDLFYNSGANNYTIATDFKMGANRHFQRNFTGLNIPINTGAAYLRFISPPLGYLTNPTGIQLRVTLIIRP